MDYRSLRERLCTQISEFKRRGEDLKDIVEIFDEIVQDVERFKMQTFDYIPHEFLVSETRPVYTDVEYKLF